MWILNWLCALGSLITSLDLTHIALCLNKSNSGVDGYYSSAFYQIFQ